MSTLYTAGPWAMQDCDDISTYEILSERTGAHVADLTYQFNGKRGLDWKPQAEANAALVASAPDILEALAICYQSFGKGMEESFRRHVRDTLIRATGHSNFEVKS